VADMTAERYQRNLGAFTQEELSRVKEGHVSVIGCGGLGGYVINSLARFGVGALSLVDGDRFSESNLNRQLFSTSETLGENKALAAKNALTHINPEVAVSAYPVMLTEENAASIVTGSSVVVDCLDTASARRILGKACDKLGIPLIHGAIAGLYGQVACIFPGDRLFETLYPRPHAEHGNALGNPVFAPQVVASVQSCEAVKLLAGRSTKLKNAVLYIDLQNYDFELIHF